MHMVVSKSERGVLSLIISTFTNDIEQNDQISMMIEKKLSVRANRSSLKMITDQVIINQWNVAIKKLI